MSETPFPTSPRRQHPARGVRPEVRGVVSTMSPPGGATGGGSVQTLHSASPRTMSWICPGQTREDGGHWPFPVRSCQTASAGSAAAMAGLGYGSDGVGGPGNLERFRDAAGESTVRPRSGVHGRLLRRRPGGGDGSAAAGSWHQPRQRRRSDSASPGTEFTAALQLLKAPHFVSQPRSFCRVSLN